MHTEVVTLVTDRGPRDTHNLPISWTFLTVFSTTGPRSTLSFQERSLLSETGTRDRLVSRPSTHKPILLSTPPPFV